SARGIGFVPHGSIGWRRVGSFRLLSAPLLGHAKLEQARRRVKTQRGIPIPIPEPLDAAAALCSMRLVMLRAHLRQFAGTLLLLAIPLAVCTTRATAADAEKGKGLYASRCAFCHGASGAGDGPAGKALKPPPTNFTLAAYWNSTTPQTVKEAIQNGK